MPGNQRRGRGEGSYKVLPSGKVQYRVRKDGHERTATGDTRKQAKANLEVKKVLPSGSFLSLAQRYRDSKTEWAKTTQGNFQTWLSSKVEGKPIAGMKGVDDNMVSVWLQSCGSKSSKRNAYKHLVAVLKHGGLTTTVKAPKAPQASRRPLTPQELANLALLAKAMGAKPYLAFLLAAETGLRRGELCGLAYEDLHEGGIWVRRSVVKAGGTTVVKATKTGKVRWVPLTPSLTALIGAGKGFVLGEGKKPISPKTVSSWFYDLKVASKMDVPFLGLHALRRTYGMTLLESGVDVVTAAELMGHDETMLLKVYAGSRRDLKTEAVRKAFGGTSRGTADETEGKAG